MITPYQETKCLENFTAAAQCILASLPNRSMEEAALAETPKRFAKMMMEQLEGEFYTNDEIAKKYGKCFKYEEPEEQFTDWVIVKDIDCFSHCEHHLALMYNMKVSIGYLPETGKILGLSKFARIAELVSKRLQTQEVMGKQIMEILIKILGDVPLCVYISGEHSCMTARGIKKPGSVTTTVHRSISVTQEDLKIFLSRVEEKK